jgi:hypothetical protein
MFQRIITLRWMGGWVDVPTPNRGKRTVLEYGIGDPFEFQMQRRG